MKRLINYFKKKINKNTILIEHCQNENKEFTKILEEIRQFKMKKLEE